jgi:hypothetical protein
MTEAWKIDCKPGQPPSDDSWADGLLREDRKRALDAAIPGWDVIDRASAARMT